MRGKRHHNAAKNGKGRSGSERVEVCEEAAKATLEGRSFLYVGGRDCQVAHLREIVSSFGAELLHHDGGLREAVSRIDRVLPSVDCVFLPDRLHQPRCVSSREDRLQEVGQGFRAVAQRLEVEP